MWLRRLSLRKSGCQSQFTRFQSSRIRHERSYAAAARSVIRFRQAGRRQIRRRPAVVGWRRSGVARSRTAASGRRSARRLHDRSSRGRSDHAQLGGRHPFSTADDQRRLRGRQRRQCAAPRSDVQDGARSFAHRSGVVLAVDNIAVGESPDVRAVLRMGRAMVDLYCESFATVPKRITLDIDDTFDAVHGGQQLRLFNAHYDEYGFQPIVVFDGEGRFVTAVLRPAKRPSGKEIKPFLRRLLRAIRAHWPNTEILLRADSHYCGPEVLDWCRANGLDYILGIAPTATLRRHVEGLKPARRRDSRPRRETASFVVSWSSSTAPKLEPGRADHRPRRSGRGRTGHPLRRHQSEQTQRSRALRGRDCRRGQAENHIKSWKTHLAADRRPAPGDS